MLKKIQGIDMYNNLPDEENCPEFYGFAKDTLPIKDIRLKTRQQQYQAFDEFLQDICKLVYHHIVYAIYGVRGKHKEVITSNVLTGLEIINCVEILIEQHNQSKKMTIDEKLPLKQVTYAELEEIDSNCLIVYFLK